MTDVLAEVIGHFNLISDQQKMVSILEQDVALRERIQKLPEQTLQNICDLRSESMFKIKGLERWGVVWSTRIPNPSDQASKEWIYTLMTRTTYLLVICLWRETPEEYLEIIRTLREDRLMIWDCESETIYKELISSHLIPNDIPF